MTFREFYRYHFLKTLLGIIVIQFAIFYWLEKRNHKPEVIDDTISVYEGHSVKIKPLSNDTDKDEEDLSISEVADPIHGNLEIDGKVLVYNAIKGFSGVDSFQYTATDGKKISKHGYIKVNVEKNEGPKANNDVIQMYAGAKVSINPLGNDNDREGDSIFIASNSNPLNGSLQKMGNTLLYIPSVNKTATDSFKYTISDGYGQSKEATVKINILSKTDSRYPWLFGDVGSPSQPGSFKKIGNKMELKASGSDIWGNADNCYFVYQPIEGDFEMVAKVSELEDTNPWAKAGIMIRESTAGNSKNAYICVSSSNGVSAQVRRENGSGCESEKHQADDVKAPYWVKMIRKGNEVIGYDSPNGFTWNEVAKVSLEISGNALVGLALTSHDDNVLGKATVEKLKITK